MAKTKEDAHAEASAKLEASPGMLPTAYDLIWIRNEVGMSSIDDEQTRARYPDELGYLDRDGVRVFWERYGSGEPSILFLPTWEVVHSRSWKFQLPYFARHATVLTFDPRGNGRSDRPRNVHAYDRRQLASDAIAVLDAAEVERAAVVSWCGSSEEVILVTEHPERVTHLIQIAPNLLVTMDPERAAGHSFDDRTRYGRGLGQEQPALLVA